MEIQLPTETTFECPDGEYSATVYSIKPKTKFSKKGPVELLRIVWSIDDLSDQSKTTLVGRDFAPTLEPGSQLREFIDLWLGEEFIQEHRKNGAFDLESLSKQKGDLIIQNIKNDRFEKPFVYVAAAYPAESQVGKQVKTLAPLQKNAA